jgi:hypothetical protein
LLSAFHELHMITISISGLTCRLSNVAFEGN